MRNLTTQYEKFITYAVDTCDTFSLFINFDFLQDCNLFEQETYLALCKKLDYYRCDEKSSFVAPDSLTDSIYADASICFYKCCDKTKGVLLTQKSIFDWSHTKKKPDDLCFYRNGKIWYESIGHDQLDWFYDLSAEDITYLEQIGIELYHWSPAKWSVYWESEKHRKHLKKY